MLPKQSSLYLSHPAALAAIYHVLLLPLLPPGCCLLVMSFPSQKDVAANGHERWQEQRPGLLPNSLGPGAKKVLNQETLLSHDGVERIYPWTARLLVPAILLTS